MNHVSVHQINFLLQAPLLDQHLLCFDRWRCHRYGEKETKLKVFKAPTASDLLQAKDRRPRGEERVYIILYKVEKHSADDLKSRKLGLSRAQQPVILQSDTNNATRPDQSDCLRDEFAFKRTPKTSSKLLIIHLVDWNETHSFCKFSLSHFHLLSLWLIGAILLHYAN